MKFDDTSKVQPNSDEMLMFAQYWTIELGRSMDDADEGSIQAFVRGMRYAYAFQESNNG